MFAAVTFIYFKTYTHFLWNASKWLCVLMLKVMSSVRRSCIQWPGHVFSEEVVYSVTRSCLQWEGHVVSDKVMSSVTRSCLQWGGRVFSEAMTRVAERFWPCWGTLLGAPKAPNYRDTEEGIKRGSRVWASTDQMIAEARVSVFQQLRGPWTTIIIGRLMLLPQIEIYQPSMWHLSITQCIK
jgi:hypothetical protein